MPKLSNLLDDLTLRRLKRLVAEPRMIPVAFRRPGSLSSVDAVARLYPDAPHAQLVEQSLELASNHAFYTALNELFVPVRGRRTSGAPWSEFLYLLIRTARPEVVIETGVFDGACSTAFILLAMRDNGMGRLISIDLPARDTIVGATHRMADTTLPPGCQPGWSVPDELIDLLDLRLGDSRELLPQALAEAGAVDVFLHDSLHTYEHMKFEYETAWPHIKSGGLLLSDDTGWSAAFGEFAARQQRPYVRVEAFGALRR